MSARESKVSLYFSINSEMCLSEELDFFSISKNDPDVLGVQIVKKLLNLTKSSVSPKASIGDRLADLYSHVCLEIRKGNFDPDKKNHNELRNILDEAALQLVMEYNPKYLGGNRYK